MCSSCSLCFSTCSWPLSTTHTPRWNQILLHSRANLKSPTTSKRWINNLIWVNTLNHVHRELHLSHVVLSVWLYSWRHSLDWSYSQLPWLGALQLKNKTCSPLLHSLVKTEANFWEIFITLSDTIMLLGLTRRKSNSAPRRRANTRTVSSVHYTYSNYHNIFRLYLTKL